MLQARCHVEGGFPSTGEAGFHDGILARGAGLGWIRPDMRRAPAAAVLILHVLSITVVGSILSTAMAGRILSPLICFRVQNSGSFCSPSSQTQRMLAASRTSSPSWR